MKTRYTKCEWFKPLAVGTKVISLDVPFIKREHGEPGWNGRMTELIGRTGTITKLVYVHGQCYQVRFNREPDVYLYRHSWIKEKEKKIKIAANRFELVLLSINNEVKKK